MPSSEIIIALVVAAIGGSGVGGLIAALVVWRKAPHETRAIDAGAVKFYADASKASAEAAEIAAQQVHRYLERIERLEQKNQLLDELVSKLRRDVDQQRVLIEALRQTLAEKDVQLAERDSVIIHMQGEINRLLARVKDLEKKSTGPLKDKP